MKRTKRLLFSTLVSAFIVASAAYMVFVYEISDDDPWTLTSCIDQEAGWHEWTCQQVLRHAALSPERVHELNQAAGAQFAAYMADAEEAEDILELLLSRGVDINAVSRTTGWTALHTLVGDAPEKVALLLRHGARSDIRDETGRTPLDIARHLLHYAPDDRQLSQTIRLLERRGQS